MTNPFNFSLLYESKLLSFYGWWEMAVCLFAFVALMAIWWHIGRKQKDLGQVWLALSVLCWSFSGGIEVFYAHAFQEQANTIYESLKLLNDQSVSWVPNKMSVESMEALQQFQAAQAYQLNGWRSIFSLFNSLFILLSLPWFRYIPSRIAPIVQSKYWPYIVGLPFLFSLLPTINKMISGASYGLVSELDVYYAILTLIFLGYVLWESFDKRRLPVLAVLSVVCVLITFVAQVYKFLEKGIDLVLFSAVFKTSLIMLFFALALSWVKELAENVIPSAARLSLTFQQIKNELGRFENRIFIGGIPGQGSNPLLLSSSAYQLFLLFAERKKGLGEEWLEIKPKKDIRDGKTYDINDHNEIKRLLNGLLDGLFGKGCWTREQHFKPLKESLFEMSEKRERKIRLLVPANQIELRK